MENPPILLENQLIPIINPQDLLEHKITPVENKFITSDKYLTPAVEEEETIYYILMFPEHYNEPEPGGYKSLLEDYKTPQTIIHPEKHPVETYSNPKQELHTETHIIESYNTPKYASHYHGIKQPIENHYKPPKTANAYNEYEPAVIEYIPIVIEPEYSPPMEHYNQPILEQYNPPKPAYKDPPIESYKDPIIEEYNPPIEAYNQPPNSYESSEIYIIPINNYNMPSPTVIPKYTPPTESYNEVPHENYALSHEPPKHNYTPNPVIEEYKVPKKPLASTTTSPLQIFFANLMIVNT